jgi:hypothetical protein
MRVSSVFLLFAYALCFGCASNDPYPKNWSPVVVGQTGCPDISGTYKNGGLGTNSQSTRMEQLSEIFLGNSRAEEETISIDQSEDGRIQVLIHGNDQSPESHALSLEDGDFECDDGNLWVTTQSDFGVDFGAVGGDITKMGFAKAEDGSLIGEERYVLAGVLVVLPMRVSEKSYVRWQPANNSLAVGGRTRTDVAVHRGRGVDKRWLNDVDMCTLYIYTMGQTVSARLFIGVEQYTDVTVAKSEYGQLSLGEGSYRIAATFDDGTVDEFDITCKYSRSIAGRHYSTRFVQLFRTPDGSHGVTVQPADVAIREMKRGILNTDDRSRVEIPVGLRSELDKDLLKVEGRCVIYFFVADPRWNLSARLFINTSQFSDLVLTPSEYAMLTLEQEQNTITARLDGTRNVDFVCEKPTSLHVAMFGGNRGFSLLPGRFGIRSLLAER